MPAISSLSPTGDPYVDGVLSGTKWAVSGLSFSFPTSGTFYGSGYGDGESTNGFDALNATQQAVTRTALAGYASVANLTFREIAETSLQHADLRFAESNAPSTAWAYYPTTLAEGGDAWFNSSSGYYNNPINGNYANTTFLHEIGHALGLKHPHEVEGSFRAIPADRDSMEYTVMSYRSYVGQSTSGGYVNETWGYAQSLMMYDIAGLQKMYGANFDTNSGNTSYSWSATTGEMFADGVGHGAPGGNRIFRTVWDGGGADTYDFSNYSTNLVINLQPGGWTTTSSTQLARLNYDGSKIAVGNIANALLYNNDQRSLIENAKGGSGNDMIYGNSADNVFWGNGGNDTLFGYDGSDATVYAGLLRQFSLSGDLSSRTVASSEEGTDTLLSIEVLQFADGRLVYDVNDAAAVVYRMYEAVLDRLPDMEGLNAHIAAYQSGVSAADLASAFVTSAEFQAYGPLADQEFVSQLYSNAFDGIAAKQEIDYWAQALESGQITRGQLASYVSDSAEHIELRRTAVESGIWDLDETAASLARLYHAALDRAPDANGLLSWKTAVLGGLSFEATADAFVFSDEFQNKYGELSNGQFVEQLYLNALDRRAESEGYDFWTDAMAQGLDRGDVVLAFAESLEHQIKTVAVLDNGILLA